VALGTGNATLWCYGQGVADSRARAAPRGKEPVQQLYLVGSTTDGENLILSDRKSTKAGAFQIALDDALRAAVSGADDCESGSRSRSARPDSQLSPREMQARLRAGQTVTEVAAEAGVDESWVERFANPVLAEQAKVIGEALDLTFAKPRRGLSQFALRESVRSNLIDKGVNLTEEDFESGWSAWQMGGPVWAIGFSYRSRGRAQAAKWVIDLRTGSLAARNPLASNLGYVDLGEESAEPEPEANEPDSPAPGGGQVRLPPRTLLTKSPPAARPSAQLRSTRAAPAQDPRARGRPRGGTRPPAKASPGTRAPAQTGPVRGRPDTGGPAGGQASPTRSDRRPRPGPHDQPIGPRPRSGEEPAMRVTAGRSAPSPTAGGSTSPAPAPAAPAPAAPAPVRAGRTPARPFPAPRNRGLAAPGGRTAGAASGSAPAVQLPGEAVGVVPGPAVRVIPRQSPVRAVDTDAPTEAVSPNSMTATSGAAEADPASLSEPVGNALDNGEPGFSEATDVQPTDVPATDVPATETPATEFLPAEALAIKTPVAESKPAESKPAESKPAESKPAESKPAESLASETPVAHVRLAQPRSAQAEPAESKPAEALATDVQPTESEPTDAQPTEAPAIEAPPIQVPPIETQGTEVPATKVRETLTPRTRTPATLASPTPASPTPASPTPASPTRDQPAPVATKRAPASGVRPTRLPTSRAQATEGQPDREDQRDEAVPGRQGVLRTARAGGVAPAPTTRTGRVRPRAGQGPEQPGSAHAGGPSSEGGRPQPGRPSARVRPLVAVSRQGQVSSQAQPQPTQGRPRPRPRPISSQSRTAPGPSGSGRDHSPWEPRGSGSMSGAEPEPDAPVVRIVDSEAEGGGGDEGVGAVSADQDVPPPERGTSDEPPGEGGPRLLRRFRRR